MDKKEINDIIESYKKEMIETLSEFVSINTIYDENSVDENNPFGKGVSNGLEFFYNLAKRDGFEVINYNNYCVEVTYGEGEIIDILAHADVVDVSNNWEFEPFSKLYDNLYVYGRGTQDDKGPLLAAYYASKAIKDNNLSINKKIRFIVGGNEESGSACLDYYYHTLHKEYPSMGFTPDAEFPLINGEKGIARLKLSYPLNNQSINVYGGKALNIVMDEVNVEINNEKKIYYGKAAHASRPEAGKNAFVVAMDDLKNNNEVFDKLYTDLNDYYGSGLGIDSYEEKLKKLTMNIGKVEVKDGYIIIILDIRYPLSITAKEMKARIENKGYDCEILMDEAPIYMDEDSFLVKTLLNSYDYFVNGKSKAFTIGGGTYAKSSKNVVAFGMMFEDDLDLMHQNNEKIRIDHYLLGAKIYLKALLDLIK
jgi:succinyl-diaminopimelate desuccinylase